MTTDDQFDDAVRQMAAERGISPEEMEAALIVAAHQWERSHPWRVRAWWWMCDNWLLIAAVVFSVWLWSL